MVGGPHLDDNERKNSGVLREMDRDKKKEDKYDATVLQSYGWIRKQKIVHKNKQKAGFHPGFGGFTSCRFNSNLNLDKQAEELESEMQLWNVTKYIYSSVVLKD